MRRAVRTKGGVGKHRERRITTEFFYEDEYRTLLYEYLAWLGGSYDVLKILESVKKMRKD